MDCGGRPSSTNYLIFCKSCFACLNAGRASNTFRPKWRTKKEEEEGGDEGKNNFLSNQDKRYPVPVNSESGDQFVTRCILDGNMKKRYPVQSDRFQACMNVFNQSRQQEPAHDNPGEKFEDPMEPKKIDLPDPEKPIRP